MHEFPSKNIMGTPLKESSSRRAFSEIFKLSKEKGLPVAVDQFFNIGEITPEYTQKKNNPEKFSEMRKKLQEESGVVISNHPGIIDILFIMKALGVRNDAYFFVAKDVADNIFSEFVESDKVITTVDENYQEKMLEVVTKGGVVIFFPTGGAERISQKIEFKRGFENIFLKNLDPRCMVYSFYINPKDIENLIGVTTIENIGKPNPKRSALFSKFNRIMAGTEKNENSSEENFSPVRIDENYSQISDWKGDPTEHYLKSFAMLAK